MRVWLIEARKQAGLTQQKLADMLEIHRSYETRLENGTRGANLNVVLLLRIAAILKIDWTTVAQAESNYIKQRKAHERKSDLSA